MAYKSDIDLKVWKLKNRNERRDFLNQYKLRVGCAICGYNKHPQALTFDHLDQSQKDEDYSSNNLIRWGRAKMLDEIRKCRVLCANCHAEDTFNNKKHMFTKEDPNGQTLEQFF
jgi:hypothetical protein